MGWSVPGGGVFASVVDTPPLKREQDKSCAGGGSIQKIIVTHSDSGWIVDWETKGQRREKGGGRKLGTDKWELKDKRAVSCLRRRVCN